MKIHLHKGDLPDGLDLGPLVAIDTETLGLNPNRDRLCLAQLSAGDDVCHAVQFAAGQYAAPNLKKLLADPSVTKLFHFARFDVAMFRRYLGVDCKPVYCTKIASKLVRTYTDRHGLKDLVRELLGVELSKEQQSSDWGAAELSEKQLAYAANDVAYLHQLEDGAGRHAGARRPHPSGQGLFRLPARPRGTGSGGLGRDRHLRALNFGRPRADPAPLPAISTFGLSPVNCGLHSGRGLNERAKIGMNFALAPRQATVGWSRINSSNKIKVMAPSKSSLSR